MGIAKITRNKAEKITRYKNGAQVIAQLKNATNETDMKAAINNLRQWSNQNNQAKKRRNILISFCAAGIESLIGFGIRLGLAINAAAAHCTQENFDKPEGAIIRKMCAVDLLGVTGTFSKFVQSL